MIAKFVGEPDLLKRNPHYAHAAPMRLYDEARIELAEKTPEFVASRSKSAQRSASAMKAVETKRQKLIQQIEEMEVEVEILSAQEVQECAIEAFNDWNMDSDGELASEKSDLLFLERITVNYIRHNLTGYDWHLGYVAGKIGNYEAVRAIRVKVYAAISAAYPWLAIECQRQKARR